MRTFDDNRLELVYHIEVLGHGWIRPLLVESERAAGETGDEDDSRLVGVTSGLCPDVCAVRRGNIDGKGGSGERDSGEK